MKKILKVDNDIYWNHNTAYHKWLLSQVKENDTVLDVGCGDGLLVYRLSKFCKQIVGLDTDIPSIEKAKKRLYNIKNASVVNAGFENYDGKKNSFDIIIFVASIHHMDLEYCINKSITLLKPKGKLLIVGLAHPYTVFDKFIEFGRVIPAKIGDLFHNVKGDVGAPISDWKENLGDIRKIVKDRLPNAKIKQALYYRYLLSWVKPNEERKLTRKQNEVG